jgi:hypothetical protein
LRTIHIGHHFFGAGNCGDDWMMAGFLSALPLDRAIRLTCCSPYPVAPLRDRFPQVEWLGYSPEIRHDAVAQCTTWLGLGGSPFQSAVSRWFIDHLVEEARFCAAADKPMYYLGIGGQDPAAYALPEVGRILGQAEHIWTRDGRTAEAIRRTGMSQPVSESADLAHLHFRTGIVPRAKPGRLTAVFNFDYAAVPPQLQVMLQSLDRLQPAERVWAVQEERRLPGAELSLYEQLSEAQKLHWALRQEALPSWPSGEWLLSSRYHAALAGAWAGSKGVVIALNEKLRSAADETGFPLFEMGADPGALADRFAQAQPVAREQLLARAELAARACAEFFRHV